MSNIYKEKTERLLENYSLILISDKHDVRPSKMAIPSANAEPVFSRPVANAPAPNKANRLFVTSI